MSRAGAGRHAGVLVPEHPGVASESVSAGVQLVTVINMPVLGVGGVCGGGHWKSFAYI